MDETIKIFIVDYFKVLKEQQFYDLSREYNLIYSYKISCLHSLDGKINLELAELENFATKLIQTAFSETEIDLFQHSYYYSSHNIRYKILETQHWKISNKPNARLLNLFAKIKVNV